MERQRTVYRQNVLSMSIFIGITTYDRPEYLNRCILSLYASKGIENCDVTIFDDCSPIWDISFLKNIFPYSVKIIRNDQNLGSDENIRKMFIYFLKSESDIFVSVDSDLIFHPLWIDVITLNIDKTDGIFSLYNSVCHPPTSKCLIDDTPFLLKEHIGSAGVVMNKNIVREIIENVPESPYYDWEWSQYLFNRGTRLLVSQRSYIQHLGIYGYNNKGVFADFGLGFIPGSLNNELWNMQTLEEIIKIQREKLTGLDT